MNLTSISPVQRSRYADPRFGMKQNNAMKGKEKITTTVSTNSSIDQEIASRKQIYDNANNHSAKLKAGGDLVSSYIKKANNLFAEGKFAEVRSVLGNALHNIRAQHRVSSQTGKIHRFYVSTFLTESEQKRKSNDFAGARECLRLITESYQHMAENTQLEKAFRELADINIKEGIQLKSQKQYEEATLLFKQVLDAASRASVPQRKMAQAELATLSSATASGPVKEFDELSLGSRFSKEWKSYAKSDDSSPYKQFLDLLLNLFKKTNKETGLKVRVFFRPDILKKAENTNWKQDLERMMSDGTWPKIQLDLAKSSSIRKAMGKTLARFLAVSPSHPDRSVYHTHGFKSSLQKAKQQTAQKNYTGSMETLDSLKPIVADHDYLARVHCCMAMANNFSGDLEAQCRFRELAFQAAEKLLLSPEREKQFKWIVPILIYTYTDQLKQWIGNEQFDKAEQFLKKFDEMSIKNHTTETQRNSIWSEKIHCHLVKAEKDIKAKRFAEAITILENLKDNENLYPQQLEPTHKKLVFSYLQRGRQLVEDNREDEALECFRKILKGDKQLKQAATNTQFGAALAEASRIEKKLKQTINKE